MSLKRVNRQKILKNIVPITFIAIPLCVGFGCTIKNNIHKQKVENYTTVLKASNEVGNIELDFVLPFGNRQIVLTKDYTDDAKKLLEEDEYPLFVNSFIEPIEQINNLKVGYNFSLTSEDGSFDLPKPNYNLPFVEWISSNNLKDFAVGSWCFEKNGFSENYYYLQDPSTINRIYLPKGLETEINEQNINNLENIKVYNKNYSTTRLLDNYKIVQHELYHSIGVNHISNNMNIPKNDGGVLETYMTTQINYDFVGDSTFDTNTLIASTCLRKILSNSQNKNDIYFDNQHYNTFENFLEKGQNNLNNQNCPEA